MRAPSAYDVIVIGAGPAGLAAAQTLVRYSDRRVLVLDRAHGSRVRGGAVLQRGARSALSYLGCWQGVRSLRPQVGSLRHLSWGGRRSASSPLGGSDLVWTTRLTPLLEMLSVSARMNGARIRAGSPVRRVGRGGGMWLCELSNGARVRGHYLIDASGRAAVLNQRNAAPAADSAICFSTVLSGVHLNGMALEATATGWWLALPIAPGRVELRWTTDPDLGGPSLWRRAMGPLMHRLLRSGRALQPLQSHAAHPLCQPRSSGQAWVAAGEASWCADPLVEPGLGRCLMDGIEAARAAHDALSGAPRLAEAYPEAQLQGWLQARALRSPCYVEMAHVGPFWARRAPARPATRPAVRLPA